MSSSSVHILDVFCLLCFVVNNAFNMEACSMLFAL